MSNLPDFHPNFFITEANYYQLVGPGFWKINEVPPQRWGRVAPHFGSEVSFAVFASGEPPFKINPTPMEVIGGIDWMRLEPNPKIGEPEINVNHYVIGPSGQNGFPV